MGGFQHCGLSFGILVCRSRCLPPATPGSRTTTPILTLTSPPAAEREQEIQPLPGQRRAPAMLSASCETAMYSPSFPVTGRPRKHQADKGSGLEPHTMIQSGRTTDAECVGINILQNGLLPVASGLHYEKSCVRVHPGTFKPMIQNQFLSLCQ